MSLKNSLKVRGKGMNKFCTVCGRELTEGSRFCPKCGNCIESSNIEEEVIKQKIDINEIGQQTILTDKSAIITELERLKEYFMNMETQYNQRNSYILFLNTVKAPSVIAWFFGGGVLAFIIYLLLFLALNWDIGGIGFIVVWIAITVGGYMHFKKKNKFEVYNTRMALKTLETELNNFYLDARNCIIAFDYSEPAIIQKLILLLRNGRADSLKEAINVMLDDIHKQTLINQQAEIVRNSENAANSARTTSALVGISLLTKRR